MVENTYSDLDFELDQIREDRRDNGAATNINDLFKALESNSHLASHYRAQIARLRIGRSEEFGGISIHAGPKMSMSKDQVESLPTAVHPGAREDVDCSICTTVVAKGTVIYKLPCNHVFHQECI